MTVSALTVVVVLAGIVLLACVIGGAIAILSAHVARRNDSGLGDEDVASILGYPMYPLWEARHQNGEGHRDDEGAPA